MYVSRRSSGCWVVSPQIEGRARSRDGEVVVAVSWAFYNLRKRWSLIIDQERDDHYSLYNEKMDISQPWHPLQPASVSSETWNGREQ